MSYLDKSCIDILHNINQEYNGLRPYINILVLGFRSNIYDHNINIYPLPIPNRPSPVEMNEYICSLFMSKTNNGELQRYFLKESGVYRHPLFQTMGPSYFWSPNGPLEHPYVLYMIRYNSRKLRKKRIHKLCSTYLLNKLLIPELSNYIFTFL